MKITMLSKADFCGSGYKVMEAVRRHTDHDMELYYKTHNHRLGHPHGTRVNAANFAAIQERINVSDVIHVKGDWPPIEGYMGFVIKHKPVVVSVSGGFFRKKEHQGLGKFEPIRYSCNLKTAFTPDLCYPEYSNIWTPHPIDSDDQSIEWARQEPPLFIHSLVNPKKAAKKGTDFMMEVVNKVKEKTPVETEVISGVTFQEVVKERKRATIFFDQFGVGFYGNSAVEAMQYGIPVCAWISPWAREQAPELVDCPVISHDEKNADVWAKTILDILDHQMTDLSIATKRWCDNIHGYKATALQWDELYKGIA